MTDGAGGNGGGEAETSPQAPRAPKPAGPPAYRVRPAGDTCYVMEHRDGDVRIYARLTGLKAKERAEAIAKHMNEGTT